MRRIGIAVAAWFLCVMAPAHSDGPAIQFQWPIARGIYPDLRGITSTFGESRGDHFHSGLDVAAAGDSVGATADGRIIYSREASDQPHMPIPGPGNLLILDHGAGWWSGYYHLTSVTRREGDVKSGEAIATAGNTGHSAGAHLHFFISTDDMKTYANPIKLLPAVTDKRPPVIGQLVIFTPKGKTLISHSRAENIRLTKSYPVYVTIIDPGLEGHTRRGIYQLRWKLNDRPEEKNIYDRIIYKDGDWILEGKGKFDAVFREDVYNLGEVPLTDGKNTLVITAADAAGNETSETFDVTVQKSP